LIFALPPGDWLGANTTFTVNSVDDIDDGMCNGGHCSLREAINAANAAVGSDEISFSLPPSSTITLSGSQLPIINDTLTIAGGTAISLTVSGDYASRVFEIGTGTAVTITDLTIAKGVTGCFGCVSGPGAGIYNHSGTLTVETVVFRKNTVAEASAGQPILAGGAIYNDDGLLTIKGSRFIENQAFEVGGGIANGLNGILIVSGTIFSDNLALGRGLSFADGGGIYNNGIAEVSSSTFIANRAEGGSTNFGGAIANWFSGTMSVDTSTFMNNGYEFTSSGGGIHNYGTIVVSNSTFHGNYASIFGGGFSNFGSGTVSNTTFSGNVVDLGSFGGGIYNEGDLLTINNSTLSENFAILGLGGGLHNDGVLQISNTIIANSFDGGDCFNSGSVVTNIANLVEDGSCSPA
jgi:CSLREA domain-containing protein